MTLLTMSQPLWSGRRAADDHQWMAEPAPPPVLRPLIPPPADPPPTPRSRWRYLLWSGGAAVVLALVLFAESMLDGNGSAESVEPLPKASAGRPAATRINDIYARVSAGVVSVRVSSGGGAASGTGFVIDTDGTIVTNAHVIGTSDRAQVRFDDAGNVVEAEVLGTDPSSDLAVLKVEPSRAPTLKALPLADSDQVRVGDQAIAIGYPLGLQRTATAGIVSGIGREIRAPNGFQIDEVIQTDAPINPGNSGGPLLDARGRVIGVNSQIASSTGGNIGIGFAVPSNTVREVVPKLRAGQRVQRPWLGVSTVPAATGTGAVIEEITPGSPAARSGLRASSSALAADGDVILSIDGTRVNDPNDLSEAIEAKAPGTPVDVVIERNGIRQTHKITLGIRPDRIP